MTFNPRAKAAFIHIGAALCLATSMAHAGPITYTFSGTTLPGSGSPSHSELFQLTVPDFLPVVLNGSVVPFVSTDPGVIACVPCKDPPNPALFFLRGGIGDSIQFQDADGTGYLYFFPADAFSNVGTHHTLAGINVNTGTLIITATPEPSTQALLMIGLGPVAVVFRRRLHRIRHGWP